MFWKGKELKTMGDIMQIIEKCDSPDEAQEFMNIYRSENPYADKNIGYISGYFDNKTMARIQSLFCVSHPMFGSVIPTPEEAFEMGVNSTKS